MENLDSFLKGLVAFFLLLFFFSCEKDQVLVYDVPPELQAIVDTFENEAQNRGKMLDIRENLIIEYGSNTEDILCGSCVFVGKQRKIQVVSSNPCWSDEITREALMLHLLGHCVLNRIEHDNETLPNGDPKSLMVGNSIDHYACIFDLSGENNCNNLYKREYYLDELFDPATPVPDWAH